MGIHLEYREMLDVTTWTSVFDLKIDFHSSLNISP